MAKPPKKPEAPKAPAPKDRPHVEHGDELYFHHDGQPFTGIVRAHGEHGATIELKGGGRHKMRWETYLGHKSRVTPAMNVVDQGEDGFVARDSHGRHRFVHDPLDEEGESAELVKSLGAIDRIMELRGAREDTLSKALKNAPGLALRDTTTKDGKRTKRWTRTAQDAPAQRRPAAPKAEHPPEHRDAKDGQTVKFKAGDFAGVGKIVAHGPKGAQVQDSSGRIHKVTWDEVSERSNPKQSRLVIPSGRKPGKSEAAGSKPAGAPVSGSAGGGDGKKPPPPAAAGGGDDGDGEDPKARRDGEDDKAYAKRVVDKEESPKELPEKHDDYFHTDKGHAMPLDQLRSTKSDEENAQGGENGPKRMKAAAEGRLGKRDPIKVTPNADGKTHSVLDGNGTFTSAKAVGWKNIPVMVVQPHDDEERVYAGAQGATKYLGEWLNQGDGLCDQWGFATQKYAPDDKRVDYSKPGGMLFIAPTKDRGSAQRKVRDDYEGDWSRLKDAARCTIAVDSIAEVHQVVEKLKAAGMVLAQPMKDRYSGKATEVGYRDVNMVIRAPNGHLCEVQVNTKTMMEARNAGHVHYETWREIKGRNKDLGYLDWSDEDRGKFEAADDEQRKIYGQAYEKLNR